MNFLTHLSLFSGVGGLDIAAEWAGMRTVGLCEWAEYPRKILRSRWPDVPIWEDIRTLTRESFYERTGLRTVDVISGGFPCQPFSAAGKRKGVDDDRYLWPEMRRVIKELRPAWVVGENVAGIVSMAESAAEFKVESRELARNADADYYNSVLSRQEVMLLPKIIKDLEDTGYAVQTFIIPACGVDAPHERSRTAIVAHADRDGGGSRRSESA
jgi:DNA (cytosine-5)-methyltransferase 1